jgi:predicted RNA-binding protein YlqC (UPF0109 family)
MGKLRMKLQELIEHVLHPIVSNPDAMEFNIIEGSAVIVIELTVHDDDVELLTKDDNTLFQSLQHLLTVSAGERKPSLELLNIAS